MATIPGIQLSSSFALNSSNPLDQKMRLSTADRLSLAFVQRWQGMIIYDTDLLIWKRLDINPVGDTTLETNWVDLVNFYGITPYNPYNSKTYAELKILKDSSLLSNGSFYAISDFRTIHNAGYDILNTGNLENIVIQANSTSSFSQNSYSLDNSDLIKYDFDDITILSELNNGNYQDGIDNGYPITISNVTPQTFDINKNLSIDSNLYIDLEDSSIYIGLSYADLGTLFTITDLGGGMYRYNILAAIDLTDPSYNYINISAKSILGLRNGNIINRIEITKNIETSFDFRGCKFARKKIDNTYYTVWDSGTTYGLNEYVIYNNSLFKSNVNNNLNKDPNTYFWTEVQNEVANGYAIYYSGEIQLLSGSEKLFPTFFDYDLATETAVFSLDNFSNIKIESSNVLIGAYGGTTIDNLEIGNESSGSTFLCSIKRAKINGENNRTAYLSSIVDLQTSGIVSYTYLKTINNSVINSTTNSFFISAINSNFGGGSSNGRFGNIVNSTIGNSYLYINLGSMSGVVIGSSANSSFILNAQDCKIGDRMNNVISRINNFRDNIIGNKWYYWDIAETAIDFYGNTFGGNIGRSGTFFMQIGRWRNNILGSNIFNTGVSNIPIAYDSYIGNGCYGLTILNGCMRNRLEGLDYNMTFSNAMYDTVIGQYNSNHNFTGRVDDCNFSQNLTGHVCASANTFRNNTIRSGSPNYDYGLTATHIHNTYPCEIMKNSNLTTTLTLTYIDDTNNIQIVAPNS